MTCLYRGFRTPGSATQGQSPAAAHSPRPGSDLRFSSPGRSRCSDRSEPGRSAPSELRNLAGGTGNTTSGLRNIIGGDQNNNTSATDATIGGGRDNSVSSFLATVGGGMANSASAQSATVAGGQSNHAGGSFSTVPGGRDNEASADYSFAAGRRAKAMHAGSFVWADRRSFSGVDFSSSGNFNFYYNSNVSGFTTSDTRLGGISNTSGEYSANSDRRLKADIEPLEDVLAGVLRLEPSSYRFRRSKNDGERSIGFIAQDVQEIFPEIIEMGETDDYLSLNYASFSVLAIGAIQEQQAVIDSQAEEIAELSTRLERLEELVIAE